MTDQTLDLTACDREPIHIPGAIQPHGLMLVVDLASQAVSHGAGDIEGRLGPGDWIGRSVAELLGEDFAARATRAGEGAQEGFIGHYVTEAGEQLDVSAHRSGEHLLIELEPTQAGPVPASLLGALEAAGAGFERASTLRALCERAVVEFRRLTGYDRVMIYRFLDDGAGEVIAEDRRQGMSPFLNHRFPATDIPRQARQLYVRNLVRVIPNVGYTPAPLRPAWTAEAPLDMSDSILRSVSPVHIQYLKNMDVGASASVSIVKDGLLWGLVACHHETPLVIPYEARAACRALAGGLARQIKAREEAEGFRDRIRLRSFEDQMVELLSREGSLDAAIARHLPQVRNMFNADSVAVVRGGDIITDGECPDPRAVMNLAKWAAPRAVDTVFHTDRLGEVHPAAADYQRCASGMLAITLTADEPWMVLWFRAEEVQVVEWAGNPHKEAQVREGETLTPRASFAAWKETVHGRARRWTVPEIEAAARLKMAVLEVRRNRQLRELNQRLLDTLAEKELLIKQNEFLIGEVNHRVQNSLQLVSSFLALQGRGSGDPALQAALEEARRRLNAVALVHRRLYRGEQIEVVDLSRYIEELVADMMASMGPEWAQNLVLDLSPVMMPTDRAVTVGLVLTELIINANKYAYDGAPGPLVISLTDHRADLRLSVADHGKGKPKTAKREGFGSRMMEALVSQLRGELEYTDNKPGLRATLSAPIQGAVTASVA
jgi:light-regulated signal transduction histidine kinase (bacteriophytochrome)